MNQMPDSHDFKTAKPPPPKSSKKIEEENVKRELQTRDGAVALIALALAVVSGVWTGDGAYLFLEMTYGPTLNTVLVSTLIAVLVTVTQAALWLIIVFVMPRLKSLKGIFLGLVLACVVQGWTFCVSTVSAAIGLTGGPAIVSTLESKRAEYAAATSAAADRALSIKKSLPALEGSKKSWCEKAESERVRGGFTGSPGVGAVSGELDGLCSFSTQIAEDARQAVEVAEKSSMDVQSFLQAMDSVLRETDLSVFEREERFLRLAAGLDAWLRQARANDFSEALVTSARVMQASVAGLPVSGGSLGSRQQTAVAGFKQSAAETARVYEDVLEGINAFPIPTIEPMTRTSILQATIDHSFENLPLIATVIGVDCAQFLAVLFFALAHNFVIAQPTRRR